MGPAAIPQKGSKLNQPFQIAPILGMHINRHKCAGGPLASWQNHSQGSERHLLSSPSAEAGAQLEALPNQIALKYRPFTGSKVEALSVSDPASRFPGPPQKSLAKECAGSLPPTLCNLRHAVRAAFHGHSRAPAIPTPPGSAPPAPLPAAAPPESCRRVSPQ